MRHKFVEFMPPKLEKNILYISMEYNVVKHLCPCGCGDEIVTTLSPAQWKLTYDGETVSLYPSIGNWSHKCKSHYFINKDEVIWAKSISSSQEEEVTMRDKEDLSQYIRNTSKKQNKKSIANRLKSFFR